MTPAHGSYYFLASAAPKIDPREKEWADDLAIIWDVSLSGSRRYLDREIETLNIIFDKKKNANAHLYFLNNRLKKSVSANTENGEYKVTGGKWDELKEVLYNAVFDGGTDFSQIDLNNIAGSEILLFSDGLSTLSGADFIKDTVVNRPIHCIISSAQADYSAMRLISGKTKGKFININALSSGRLKDELLTETPLFLGAEHGDGVREVYPGIATPVSGNFSVAGISDAKDAELTLLFGFGGTVETRVKVRLDAKKSAGRGNAHKIWAQKKIAELDLDYEKNRDELTALGTRFGIVTRNASLLVLELAVDYIKFNIEPPASEPTLLETYRRLKRWAEVDRSRTEGTMFRGAIYAADNLDAWWNIDFTRKEPKYDDTDLEGDEDAGADTPEDNGPDETGFGEDKDAGDAVSEEVFDDDIFGPGGSEDDIFGPGGLATVIDSIISGVNKRGLMSDGDYGGAGRKGVAGVGYWVGYGSGTCDGGRAASGAGYYGSGTPCGSGAVSGVGDYGSGTPCGSAGGIGDTPGGCGGSARSYSPRGDSRTGESQPAVKVQLARYDNHYLKELTGETADDYQLYLKLRERDDYAGSPAFYFDMANWFYTRGDKETALRVLTSIAELGIEDAPLYRLLGYRFKEYGEYELQKFVCKKVLEWRPMDPQSYRDYALALADNGEAQAALDSLYSILTRTFTSNTVNRASGLYEVLITEINRLIAQNPDLNTSKIDESLLINIPVDIRAVINWNMDNTNVNLYVKDSNECHSRECLKHLGGHISVNNSAGYGPEQFMLKKAAKGKYQVYVNYEGKREFAAAGPLTVMAEIYSDYVGANEQRRVVCLQLRKTDMGKDVLAAEFEF